MARRRTTRRYRDREIQEWTDRFPTPILECRELQHAWKQSYVQPALDGGWDRVLVCTRCGTHKRQILDADGYLIASVKYTYVDGYLLRREESVGRLDAGDRASLRIAAIRRSRGE